MADPYYDTYRAAQGQATATGQSGAPNPQQLASIIQGDISAQQQQASTANLQSAQATAALENANSTAQQVQNQAKQAKQQNLTSTITGGLSAALAVPTALKNLGIVGGGATQQAGATGYNTTGLVSPTTDNAISNLGDVSSDYLLSANPAYTQGLQPALTSIGTPSIAGPSIDLATSAASGAADITSAGFDIASIAPDISFADMGFDFGSLFGGF